MSDQPEHLTPADEREESVATARHKPPPVRTYYDQVRSLLGKRGYEDDKTTSPIDAPATTESYHPTSYHTSDSGAMDDADGFTPGQKRDEHDIPAIDGATDRVNRRWGKPVAAIFIHAGAGYHSAANEEHHLKACSEAAHASMKALKRGRSAVEAVEAAIKVLENKEITNAGYGSNLAIDGTVECDATIVDHLGRSGACGAVSNIKNPISLARMILESSSKPLSLRRVPPNLLAGEGARDFAKDVGIELVSNDYLVSKNARDRFMRWRDDLKRAENRDSPTVPSNLGETLLPPDQDPHKEHTKAILTGTWNEGQPDSPSSGSPCTSPQNLRSPVPPPGIATASPHVSPKDAPERSPLSFLGGSSKRHRLLPTHSDDYTDYTGDSSSTPEPAVEKIPNPNSSYIPPHDGASDEPDAIASYFTQPLAPPRLPRHRALGSKHGGGTTEAEDLITDTVGAIAIDQLGRIAAGSSSGGIGMKHRGRIGPAALVNVGTAVIPADEQDMDNISVAAVTSGTGEHMATTMASQRCAERIYQGSVRGTGGRDVPSDDENMVLASFITNDFLDHPGVRESTSPGAIGAMAVKKAPGGYYLYFAHNTESFALASMGSNDLVPSCVMSRINEGGSSVAQGARKIRI
ncbi:nucleophile aminohydrolase [Xylaria telfairii]|nr:nucleophile aminohydrolase [Xylaria telfairii]